jgi:lysophospholipase L1-like esterase
MTTILVFGDSIAYGAWDAEGGWVSRLRKYLDSKTLSGKGDSYYILYNLGVSGDTTADLLARFDAEIKARIEDGAGQNDLVVIFAIGINDPGMQKAKNSVSPEEFQRNIEKLSKKAKALTGNVLFMGSQPVDEKKTHPVPWNIEMHYDNESIERDNRIIEDVCRANKTLFIDLSKPFGNSYKKLLEDGVHPNSEGHKLIYQTVRDFLIKRKLID